MSTDDKADAEIYDIPFDFFAIASVFGYAKAPRQNKLPKLGLSQISC